MPTTEEVQQALKAVMDPELGVNVVDLGLVYNIILNGDRAHLLMTMTSPACPMGELIVDDARETLLGQFHELKEVEIDLTFEPPWSPEKMTDFAKEQLGWRG